KHFLRDRDQIEIGRHKLVYCADDDAAIETEAATGAARPARTTGDAIEVVRTPLQTSDDTSTALPSTSTPGPAPAPQAAPLVRGLTGFNAGASVPLIKAETTIGRPGVQVAAIVKSGNAFLLKRIEGGEAPLVNGRTIVGEAAELANGDRIDIAGARLELVLPEQPEEEVAVPDGNA